MPTDLRGGSQRIRYYDDQLLTARDMGDDVAYEARMRGLHVRMVHNTWGAALGFEVYRDPTNCPGVVMGPGLAYDCLGREIICARTICLDLPTLPDDSAPAWWFDLVIRYREDEAFQAEQHPGTRCPEAGFEAMEERPTWRWLLAGPASPDGPVPELAPGIRLGEDIPLARARINAERQVDRLDYALRRNAQGLVRPYIAGDQVTVSGASTEVESTTWSAVIDTRAAGFSQSPFYFATLADYPCFDLNTEDPEILAALRGVLGPFISIQSPTKHNFRLEVRFGLSHSSTDFGHTILSDCQPVFKVNWLGLEPVSGCPPPRRPVLYLTPQLFTLMPVDRPVFNRTLFR